MPREEMVAAGENGTHATHSGYCHNCRGAVLISSSSFHQSNQGFQAFCPVVTFVP